MSTTSTTSVPLAGVQHPRVEHVPDYVSSAGLEAVEFCDSIGLHLDPWQQHVITESLGERRDGQWAAFEVGLLVPRQNGKGSCLEARELAGMFLFGEQLILHSAHEFKTAAEAFRRVLFHVENNRDLRKRVRKIRTSHGEEGIELTTGARLRFVARSTGSGRGFTGDTVILDEAYNLSSEGMSALLPTLSARPNPQIWYTSSAGMAGSEQLRRVRERGLAGEGKRLAFFEWSSPADVDLDSREAWAQANPALGIRITEEFIESERDAMDDLGFSRERLGIWFDPRAQMVIDGRKWADIADPASQVTGQLVFALDATPERSAAAIAVAGRRADGLGHVEVVDSRPGTGWAVDRVVELQERHKPSAWLLDPASAAGAWIPALQERGIEPVLVTGREMAQACGALYEDVVENSAFRHLDQPQLNAALSGARKRPVGDAWAWHRRDSGIDISPLVASTLAWHGLALQEASPPKRSVPTFALVDW
jgi:phage terminase large subunit-like protein